MNSKTTKLWGGRFTREVNPILEQLNSSIQYDQQMYKEDIEGSCAYAEALNQAGLLTLEETEKIKAGLNVIKKEFQDNIFVIKPTDEDIHTAVERRLKELIGEPATKLHTGRSRNDQVATDMRLWLRSNLTVLENVLFNIIKAIIKRANSEKDALMPGYTHLQRAQPIKWSHWLLSYAWYLKADTERLTQLYDRVNVMPLGSGALAGNPFPINRELLASNLKFCEVSKNSILAVGDRDFIAEFLFWASLTATHLSRLAEDLILFSTQEFGFISLDDSFSTGSSLMPQKKNPDSLELIRGKAGRIFGQSCGFLMTLKGLPSCYNKDLQEDKEAMFEAFSSLTLGLKVATGVLETLRLNERNCNQALTSDMLATDIAYYLVRKGVPFRDAHHLAGQVVVTAESKNTDITKLTIAEMRTISNMFDSDVQNVWNYKNSVEQYKATGGTSTESVLKQIQELEEWLSSGPKCCT